MTVVDDLALIASVLPPSLSARYQAQLVWAVEANRDIGFRFTLQRELINTKGEEDKKLQLRNFNLETSKPCGMLADEEVLASNLQKPNRGGREEKEVLENNCEGGDPSYSVSCGSCDFKTLKLKNLRRHILLNHSKKEDFLGRYYKNYKRGKHLQGEHTCLNEKCGKKFKRMSNLWLHMCYQHAIVAKDLVSQAALGVRRKSSNTTLPEKTDSPVSRTDTGNTSPILSFVREEAMKSAEVSGSKLGGSEPVNATEESRVKRKEEIAQRRKSKRTVMREVSPACEYERIRVANIAERMELFQMLDIGGAVAGAKQ